MRLLIPTVDYPPIEGGISTLTVHLARELAAMGHEVTVLAPALDGAAAFDANEAPAIVRYPGYGLGYGRLAPLFRATLAQARDTDAVLAINVAYGGIVGRWLRARRGIPYLCFAYAYEFLKFQRAPMRRRLLRNVYANAAHTVAISRFTAARLKEFGAPPDTIRVILPGAPPAPAITPAESNPMRARLGLGTAPYLLCTGRFIPRKGQRALIQAMPSILERCPGLQLVLAGRGPEMAACREHARALGIDGLVHFPGYVEQDLLAALYAGCTCFVLPAAEAPGGQVEGFGLVFTEAHAHGKPVVAARSGGVPDAVIDGETGLLVPPDDPEALAKAVTRIVRDPEFAAALGAAGRRRVERELNWERFASEVCALIEESA